MRRDEKIRWGILSTGTIAHKFAEGLSDVPDAELVAVGSRKQATADAFAEEHDVPHRHGSYEALVDDPEIDVVYVGTPHPFHKENSLLALRAGKAVLCEKPLTLNAAEAEEIIDAAQERHLFLMEAMWTRFIPAVARVRRLLAEGAIGEIRLFQADFGFRADFDPESRLFAPELGGGALLDVGIYPISLAFMVLGAPDRVFSLAHLAPTGVDDQEAILFGYPDGALAALIAANRTSTPTEAVIMGTKGHIRVHAPFLHPTRLTLSVGGDEEILDLPYEGNGYNYEAAEVGRCLRAGRTESDVMPLDESLAIMRTMDEIRDQWGLTYPMET